MFDLYFLSLSASVLYWLQRRILQRALRDKKKIRNRNKELLKYIPHCSEKRNNPILIFAGFCTGLYKSSIINGT